MKVSPLLPLRRADAAALTLHLDRGSAEPLSAQLSRQLRALILSGRITARARLPASRALAADLRVSRATVVLAFDQLASEGYVEGRHGSGLFVATGLPEQAKSAAATVSAKTSAAGETEREHTLPARPFQLGAVDATLFPYQRWSRLLYRTWRSPEAALTQPSHAFGWPALRRAIAQHLLEWRGIECVAEQIVITSGTADATDLIVRTCLAAGATVCVEEPGYATLRYTLAGHGLAVRSIPIDEDGFDIRAALSAGPAAAAIVTPSRQFPLGVTMPVARRLELLEWAAATGGAVIEDDFDSEYRYEGSPLPALMSLDRHGRTIYLGSFSKVLSPTLRLGFVVLPPRTIAAARAHLARRGTLASLVAQPALAQFIASGDYATHIRRSRRIYARRMAALMDEGERLSGLVALKPTIAGMHVIGDLAPKLARRISDREAVKRLAEAGIVAQPLSAYYALRPDRSGLVLGFAGFAEDRLRAAVVRTARVLARA